MKMAAAEALYHTRQPGVVLAVHHRQPERLQEVFPITLPHLLSFLATGNFGGHVQGIDNIQSR